MNKNANALFISWKAWQKGSPRKKKQAQPKQGKAHNFPARSSVQPIFFFRRPNQLSLFFLFLTIMLLRAMSRGALLVALLYATCCGAFYLPGVAPHDYASYDPVPLYVNSLTPMSNQQVKSVISYDYYYEKFHFCQPENGPEKQAESLGSVLFGDRIFSSPFEVRCSRSSWKKKETNKRKSNVVT